MKKAMLSQPMKGLTEEQIRSAGARAVQVLAEKGYEVLDTFFSEEFNKFNDNEVKHKGVIFLAKSLESMSTCDAVYFVKGWSAARGCKLEHEVAKQYGIEVLYE